ncbi:MAG: hypothetical protein K2J82_05575 [Muribaculaceae bacterium]|nr:hypothetical protein [Muribaculaceae bacterium]
MKKLIFLMWLLLCVTNTTYAEQQGVFMEFHRKSMPEKNTQVNRAPMRIPMEVIYDSESRKIEVVGTESIEVEVFLFRANGMLEGYSLTLNCEFSVSTPDSYILQIQGDGWYAEGEIRVY